MITTGGFLHQWQNFFFMLGGAAAALTGLIFVAVSMHDQRITGHHLLREMAAGTLQLLVIVLMVSAECLMPIRTAKALGVTLLSTLAFSLAVGISTGIRVLSVHGELPPMVRRRAPLALTVLVLAGSGGIRLILGQPAGLFLIAPALLVMTVFALVNGWFLLATAGSSDVEKHLYRNPVEGPA